MKKGFSLLEIIISIAFLAFLSGFILQMFLVSSDLNQKAKNLDKASTIAMNYIELFKSYDSAEQFIIENFKTEALETEDGYKIAKHFDKDWNETQEGSSYFTLNLYLTEEHNSNESYIAYEINSKSITKKIEGSVFNIKTDVINNNEIDSKKQLVEFNTSRYFIY